MEKKSLLLSVCCLIAVSASAQKLDWYSLWGSSSEGSHIRVNRLAIDSEDNTYTAADFCGNAVVVEDETLVSKQGSDLGDAVLIKTTPAKEIAWVRTFSDSKQSRIYDIVIDRQDNIIVAGTFTGTLNPGGQGTLTFDDGDYDDFTVNAFVVRFDKNGTLLNQWRIPALDLSSLRAAVDANGNVYVAGTYASNIQFDNTLVGTYGTDNQLFLAKYSPSGEVLMTKYTEISALAASNAVVQVDTNGDIYLAGTFTGTYTFAGKTLTTTSNNDMFLLKYNAAGTELWAKQIGGGGNEKAVDLVLSPLGDVAVGGNYTSIYMTITDVDSTFTYKNNTLETMPHIAVTTFAKDGDFRWQYWYGYGSTSPADATICALRCTNEGIYHIAGSCSGRAADISTGTGLVAGVNSGLILIDGQPLNHNTNGGADALYLVLSPEGGLCSFSRPGGQQTEVLKDIAITSDKKNVYFLYDLCARAAKAHIPLNNFFASFTDIDAKGKLSDFTSIAVPCPETVATGGSYTATYAKIFFSGCLLRTTLPEVTPDELPRYTAGTPYSQAFSMSNPVGTAKFIPLNTPPAFSLSSGQLTGTPTGIAPYSITVIASDDTGRDAYFNAPGYASDVTWATTHGKPTTRGNSRNVRNFILKSTEDNSSLKGIPANTPKVFYPTIVTTALQVNTDAEQFAVTVYNLTGIRVLGVSNQKTISVATLPSGVYIAEIIVNGQKITERIIVK